MSVGVHGKATVIRKEDDRPTSEHIGNKVKEMCVAKVPALELAFGKLVFLQAQWATRIVFNSTRAACSLMTATAAALTMAFWRLGTAKW